MRATYERFLDDLEGYESYYMAAADPHVVLSNIVTEYAATNHRPAGISSGFKSDALPEAHVKWRTLLREQDLTEYLHVTTDDKWRTSLPLNKPLSEAMVSTLSLLTAAFRPVLDYSEFVKSVLTQTAGAGWDATAVMLPALLYPRDHLHFPSLAMASHVKWHHCYQVPGGRAVGHDQIVKGLLVLDTVRFDSRLLSKYEADNKLDGRSPTERPIGEMKKSVKLTRQTGATYGPFEIQPLLLWANWHDGLWQWLSALTRAKHQQSAEIIRTLLEEEAARDFCMKRKLHDVISATASLSKGVRAIGHYGEKPLIALAQTKGLEKVEPLNVIMSDPGAVDRPTVNMLNQFIEDLMKPQRKMSWLQLIAEEGFVSFREFAYAMSSIGFSAEWDEQADALGWKSMSLSAGTVDYYGADFAFTDGEAYSKPTGHCLAGFSPVLGLNNRRAYGSEISLEKSWNTAPADDKKGLGGSIGYSVVTVKGYVEVRSGLAHERWTLPASACLGEAGARPRFLLDTTDEGQTSIKVYYTAKSPGGYLVRMYSPVAKRKREGNNTFFQRDWDAVATSAADATARDTMHQNYLDEFTGEVKSATDIEYAYNDEGFLQRFPVKTSRNGNLYYVTAHGYVFASLKQRGNVLFSGETSMDITLEHGTSEIEAIVDVHTDRLLVPDLGGMKSDSIAKIPEHKALGAPIGIVRA